MTSFKVTGPAPVIGSDGEPVPTGGTVELDEDVINVPALIRAGAVLAASGKVKRPTVPADPPADDESKET